MVYANKAVPLEAHKESCNSHLELQLSLYILFLSVSRTLKVEGYFGRDRSSKHIRVRFKFLLQKIEFICRTYKGSKSISNLMKLPHNGGCALFDKAETVNAFIKTLRE